MVTEYVLRKLEEILGAANVYASPAQVKAYECDGYVAFKSLPGAVVFPESTEDVSRILKLLSEERVPYVARGAGTGLTGGATPTRGDVVISLAKMDRLLSLDLDNHRAVVQPGFVNLELTKRVSGRSFYYAPDPSSQSVCTIGGNFAENAGGSHCLKYGVTTNHVTAATVVLPDGEIVELGSSFGDADGLDLLGLFVGSEGTLGIATEITVKILKKPQAVQTIMALFDRVEDASASVSGFIAEGIIPAACEMMDQLAMQAVDKSRYHVGYPSDVEAVLIVEVDGLEASVRALSQRVMDVCLKNGVREVRSAKSEEERALWWSSRKMAFPAIGRISPDYMVQDGVIPRSRLADVLKRIESISQTSGLRIANVFHAGDGNLHPLICYDSKKGETEIAQDVGRQILELCVDVGGSITGEHGVGIEKIVEMQYQFTQEELALQQAIRDQLDPKGLCNAGKLIPTPSRCMEMKGVAHPTVSSMEQILSASASVQTHIAR
ncbi:FAD-linked oxidase C-terminal domain-containing protein [Ferroacidibacillus organovorans]|uniref:Glycolate oxidase subunit GlcD n=1 Tax=Ferroacidibacillus organovorans TaxID=1765683 RepID=A0A101XSN5_9BACL|nr:FAD-linked oxidase C-terminal domain-containing protein [Ferroacidibacillus organovorans]KUO96820.1 glycolate oxidase subunit GlcD [Ferroacidibacillus organovorans]